MSNRPNGEESKTVVDAQYQSGVGGRLREFAPYLHPDFTTTAPKYLPWGGFHPGAAFFRDEVLPNLPDVLDFRRFSYDVFLAENERVVAARGTPQGGAGRKTPSLGRGVLVEKKPALRNAGFKSGVLSLNSPNRASRP
jgi:hypothetical protein